MNETPDAEKRIIYIPRPPVYDPQRVLTEAQKERMREAFRKAGSNLAAYTPAELEVETDGKEEPPDRPDASPADLDP